MKLKKLKKRSRLPQKVYTPEVVTTPEREAGEFLSRNQVTLSDLIDRSHEIQENCEDFSISNVNSSTFRFVPDDDSLFGITYFPSGSSFERSVGISNFALSQLCNKVGVPFSYMKKCISSGRVPLAGDNINSWIDSYGKNLFIREYNGHIRGVLTDRYSVCDTPLILETAGQVIDPKKYKIKGHFMSEEFTHIRMVSKTRLPIPGEDLFPGISIDTSDVGRSNLVVNFFIWKQVCTNGLIVPKKFGVLFQKKHVGMNSDEFQKELVASIQLLPQVMSKVTESIKATSQISLEEAFEGEDSLQKLIQNVRTGTLMNESEAKKVIELMQNNTYGKTRWGLINSITQVAQDYTLDRRLMLERAAGRFLVA